MSEYARLVIAADSTQVRQAERDLTALERQSSATESTAVKMASRIAVAFGGIKLASHISDVVQLASRYDQMGLVMETVGRNTGRSAVELAALDKELQKTGISALQSRNNIVKMMSANIDLSKATELARLAQDAAVIANTNSSEAFERLIKGIQSAEKETLETMGLNVNFAQSYQKLAAELGKSADQLTVLEKTQAATTAALEAGVNITGAYDASMENAGKQLGSTTRHLENLQIALGSAGQGEFGLMVDGYSASLKFLGENADIVAQLLKTTLYTGATVAAVAITKKTAATVSSMLASRALAAEELRLAQAEAASASVTASRLRLIHQKTGATTGLTVAISAHEAAERRLAAAQAASVGIGRGLLGVMGGPAGLVITAAMVAASFYDWSDSAGAATASLIDHNLALDDTISKFKELGEEQRQLQRQTWAKEQADALGEAEDALSRYVSQGVQGFQNLGLRGLESAATFRGMVAEVERGERSLASVTEWYAENTDVIPFYTESLVNAAAAHMASAEKAEGLAEKLGLTEKAAVSAATAQKGLAESTVVGEAEWKKYVDQLTKARDLIGATAAVEAAYTAQRMGASSAQIEQVRLIADQTDALRAFEGAVKSGDKAEQERLKVKLTALIVEEDALKAAAVAQELAAEASAKAEEDSATRQVAAMQRVIDQTLNLVRGRNLLLVDTPQPNMTGISLLTNGLIQASDAGKGAANTAETVEQRVKKMLDQIVSGAGPATGGVKRIDDAFQSLYDSLFPAEAAQKKYNEQLALLKARLSGDQLAKAIDRLNDSMGDGGHSGPADAIEAYRKELERLEDKINPAGRAAREFAEEQAFLRKEIERTSDPLGKYTALLVELERQYEENSRVTNEWTKWTESALERVDSAFADAWRNIGQGFDSFRDGLTNAFKQMLAELAHMAITRPIIMQIGAAMGIGGGTQGNNGIWGMLGGSDAGGGSGGSGVGVQQGFQVASLGRNLYSMYSGGLAGMTSQLGGYAYSAGNALGWQGLSNFGTGMQGANLAPGVAGPTTAGSTGAQGLGANVGSMANPIMWALAAIMGSKGFYEAGFTLDHKQVADQKLSKVHFAMDPGLALVADSMMKATQFASEKVLQPLLGEKWGNILSLGPLFSGISNTLNRAIFGSGEQFKRTVGSAQGVYSGGEYTGMGTVESFYGGSRKFGDDFDGALHDLADVFSRSLGGLFDMFDIDSTIETEVTGRLRRTSGRLAADFYATIEGELVHVFGQYGRKGNVGESMEAFFDDIMGRGLVEAIAASSLPEYLKELTTGLTEAEEVADTISSLVTRFTAVNDVVELVNVSAFAMTDAGLRGADALIAMSGGLESLLESTATYYDQFFSAAEKQADTIEAVEKAFAAADITLADSRESYRAMVEDIDVTTEAGREMFATMMGLAGRAAEYYSIVEQQAAQALATALAAQQQALSEALGGASSAFAMLQRSVVAERNRLTAELNRAAQAEQAAAQRAASAASASASARVSALSSAASASQELVRVMLGLDRAMSSALDRLRSTDRTVVALRREQSVSMLRDALDWGRAGNSLTAFDGLEGALDVAATLDTGTFRTLTDFQREQGRTSHLIYELQQLNGEQLTIEERMLEQLRASASAAQASASQISSGFSGVSAQLQEEYDRAMAALDEELASAQSQLDALNGVDNSIISVGAAVDQMSAAVVAAIYAQNQYLTGGDMSAEKPGATAGLEATIARMYQSTLGVSADQQGIAHWLERLQGGDTLRTLQDALNAAARTAAIPAFASGGIHSGGLRLVGENGPELEVTGPSRIYSAGQTASMLNGGGNADTVTELRQLRTEIHNDLRAIAKHTMQTAKRLDGMERIVSDWDAAGVPQERAFA